MATRRLWPSGVCQDHAPCRTWSNSYGLGFPNYLVKLLRKHTGNAPSMTTQESPNKTDFDEFSAEYDVALAHGLSVTGEDKNYFARGRIAWLANCLRQLKEEPQSVMDFGCGTGSAIPFMLDLMAIRSILGVDVSMRSLEIARQTLNSERTQFLLLSQYEPNGQMDLTFCNGVFHHIPVEERAVKLNYISRSLRSRGLLAFWENNPWNPGARYVMSRIPFDHDANTLALPEARRML